MSVSHEETLAVLEQEAIEFINYFKEYQETHLTLYGSYFQGLNILSVTPQNGELTPVDNLHAKPTDENIAWEDTYYDILPTESGVNIKTDVITTPAGKGYTIVLEANLDNIIYQKTFGFKAAENFYPTDWVEIIEEVVEEEQGS